MMPTQGKWPGQGRTVAQTASVDGRASGLISAVYGWMGFGIAVTAAVAFWLLYSGATYTLLLGAGSNAFLVVGLVQLGVAMAMSFLMERLSVATLRGMFLAYASLTGVTISTLALMYTGASLASVFGLTAAAFTGLAVFGAVTKRNLGPMGTFLMMGLFGLLGLGLLNLFFRSAALHFGLTIAGLIVFAGLTAYESQRIKEGALQLATAPSEVSEKFVIMGAFSMYVNFIMLFIRLLQLLGDRRR